METLLGWGHIVKKKKEFVSATLIFDLDVKCKRKDVKENP